MSDPTLQQQSDYLAEHLLGWRMAENALGGAAYWFENVIETHPTYSSQKFIKHLLVSSWHPHASISQCFEYIVPAMRERGYDFYLKQWKMSTNGVNDWVLSVEFEEPLDGTGAYAKSDSFSRAIVRSAYEAVKAMKEEI